MTGADDNVLALLTQPKVLIAIRCDSLQVHLLVEARDEADRTGGPSVSGILGKGWRRGSTTPIVPESLYRSWP